MEKLIIANNQQQLLHGNKNPLNAPKFQKYGSLAMDHVFAPHHEQSMTRGKSGKTFSVGSRNPL